jgi:spore cortex formation protein SpoVR/YcgB (stage V sporulation)
MPLFTGPNWDFGSLRRVNDAIERIAFDELGLDIYPVQIEVITSEQMLDAYSSVGLPLMYKHWSFGKRFAYHETLYRKGLQGLAYEIVINSNPVICYIMEENSMTMQTLVIAHAAFGHNHFFKNNYLFRRDPRLSELCSRLRREMRGAPRARGGRAGARRGACPEGARSQPLRAPLPA